MSDLIKKVDRAINLLWRIDTSEQSAEVRYFRQAVEELIDFLKHK